MELQGTLPMFPEGFSLVGTACSQTSSTDFQGAFLALSREWLLLVRGAGSQIRCLPPAHFWGSSGSDVCGGSPQGRRHFGVVLVPARVACRCDAAGADLKVLMRSGMG